MKVEQWVIDTLERVAEERERQADMLAQSGDYNCQFPEAEASAIRIALGHLRAL